mgnify:FL=1|tara:strand:- start:275 stop:517 length:243 start_codon:yes stop_codon:yes gene_type:complete
MQENKIKNQALLKVQSKIFEQKRFIKELENDIETNNLEFEEIELQLNNVLTQLEVYEYIKKCIKEHEIIKPKKDIISGTE